MSPKISKELSNHRLEQAKGDLYDAKLLYEHDRFLSANNRAYYAIFHAIKSILALEPIDFKKHKDVISYCNKNYINTEIFPKSLGRKIVKASKVREDSDYVDEFVIDAETTNIQIQTAEELIILVEKYIKDSN